MLNGKVRRALIISSTSDTSPIGFTAIVNKELSVKYANLVDNAPQLITALPWGKHFEVDVFRRPDFTALEIVNFATGGKATPPSLNCLY